MAQLRTINGSPVHFKMRHAPMLVDPLCSNARLIRATSRLLAKGN
jgi:hypothetical protein